MRSARFAFFVGFVICGAPMAVTGLRARAAPVDGAIDARTALAIRLVDELRTLAPALPDEGWEREWLIGYADVLDFMLGRRAAYEMRLKEQEAAAAKIGDEADRLNKLTGVASGYAVVDPVRARRILAQVEAALEKLPADRRAKCLNLAYAYFHLGDYGRSIRAFQNMDPKSALLGYAMFGRHCIEHKETEPLAELRKSIRAIQPKPDDLDPKWNVDFYFEQSRIDALAKSGLPEEAAALYEWCWATGSSGLEYPHCLQDIARGFVQAGKKEAAVAFVRKHLPHIKPELKHLVAVPAAYAGDYALVDELLADTSNPRVIVELRPVIVLAHRAGDVETRDALFARYREALGRRPKEDEILSFPHELPCDVAMVEAAIGRYDAALAKLPKYKGKDACAVRAALVDLMLREQGKRFGRTSGGAAADYLDLREY
jgi:tetratricopeptide (TPR) repeat protein